MSEILHIACILCSSSDYTSFFPIVYPAYVNEIVLIEGRNTSLAENPGRIFSLEKVQHYIFFCYFRENTLKHTLEKCFVKKRTDVMGFHTSFKAVSMPFICYLTCITVWVCESSASVQRAFQYIITTSTTPLVAAPRRVE